MSAQPPMMKAAVSPQIAINGVNAAVSVTGSVKKLTLTGSGSQTTVTGSVGTVIVTVDNAQVGVEGDVGTLSTLITAYSDFMNNVYGALPLSYKEDYQRVVDSLASQEQD